MRVSVFFRNKPILVPVGDGKLKVSELVEQAITRYKKTDARLADFSITVRSLRLMEGGSFVDFDDEVADVLDDKEAVLADFDINGDSMSTSSQESGPPMSLSASRLPPSHPEGVGNLLSESSQSLVDELPWTPSIPENDVQDVVWRQPDQRATTTSGDRGRNYSGSSLAGSERLLAGEVPHEVSIDGSSLRQNRSSYVEAMDAGRLRLPLSDTRARNSYAGPGIYEREHHYDNDFYSRSNRSAGQYRKPFNPPDPYPQGPADYMRLRFRNQRLSGGYHNNSRSTENFQQPQQSTRPAHGMYPPRGGMLRHGNSSSALLQGRVPSDDASFQLSQRGGYEDTGVDYFLSQPPYSSDRHGSNEPSGYALSQPAHTLRGARSSVIHAADLDPNSEAPHLRHVSQDEQSSHSDTPTYRISPVPHGMRLDAATYHGNQPPLTFSDNDDDLSSSSGHLDNSGTSAAEDSARQRSLSNKYNPFQRNRRLSIQRDGLVYARWAEYCEVLGIPESDEEKESVLDRTSQSRSSSHEELDSYSSPHIEQEPISGHDMSGRGYSTQLVQSATDSEGEDDLGNIHIIELHKGSHDLGIKMKQYKSADKDCGIFIERLSKDGFAAFSKKLQINDRILACNGCDFTKLANQKAEDMFGEMMDEPLLRMAISRGNQIPSGDSIDGSDVDGSTEVASTASDPGLPNSVTNTREIGTIYDIRLVKGAQGLGFGVTTRDNHMASPGGRTQPIYIKSIARDGAAFKGGQLKLGDRLLKVNNVSVEQMNQSEVVQLMRALVGVVSLQVSRQETHSLLDDKPANQNEVVESINEVAHSVSSNRTVMSFDIIMHNSDAASLGVTVHGRTRVNSPSHSSKNADVGIYIKSIVPGGLAALDGRIQQGDQVLCINGHNLAGKSNSEALDVLKKALSQLMPSSSTIQLVVSRKVPVAGRIKSMSPTAHPSNEHNQSHEVGIDIGNASMVTMNSQSSQSSAGTVRQSNESYDHVLSRQQNESETLRKYNSGHQLENHSNSIHGGYPDSWRARGSTSEKPYESSPNSWGRQQGNKPTTKRATSESWYDHNHLNSATAYGQRAQSVATDPPSSANSSSSGSGLISPTGITVSIKSHDNGSYPRQLLHSKLSGDGREPNDVFSSTPVHRSHVDYPSQSLPRPPRPSRKKKPPSPTSSQLEASAGSDSELMGYFKRDAPGRISVKKGKQAPQRDFSQFYFRNTEPKLEGDDSSSIATELMRTGSVESVLTPVTNRSPVLCNVSVGPSLGLAKSSSLESLQTILAAQAAQRLEDRTNSTSELVIRGRETRTSFRKAVDKTYEDKHDYHHGTANDNQPDMSPFDRSLLSYTKNPKGKPKRRGFLKSLFKKDKKKRLSSYEDNHGDIILLSDDNKLHFDHTPPARVEMRSQSHHHGNNGNKMYQRYSMSVLDNFELEDDDITATVADV